MNASGEIAQRSRRIALGWTAGEDGTPDLVRLTPVR